MLLSALGFEYKRIAVGASYIGRIAFVCAYGDLVKCTVVFRLAVVCTANDSTFNTFVFTICVHKIYPPHVVRYYCVPSKKKIVMEKYVKKEASRASF